MARLSPAKGMALGAMTVALNVLSVYVASMIPTMRAAVYFLSALFVYVLLCEKIYGGAILSYIASSLIVFLIVPNKLAVIPYIALLGHFGIFKIFIDRKVKDKFIGFMLKLIYCNAFTGIAVVLLVFVFEIKDFIASIAIAPWIIALLMQAVFVALNVLYTLCQQFYDTKLRFLIVSKR